jgi:hypothetical protein
LGHSMGLPWRHFGRTRLVYSGMHSRARARSYMYVYICIYIYIYICIYMYIYIHISIYSTGEPRGFSQGTRMNERYSLNGYSKGTRRALEKGTQRVLDAAEKVLRARAATRVGRSRHCTALRGRPECTDGVVWHTYIVHKVLTGYRSMELGGSASGGRGLREVRVRTCHAVSDMKF